MWLPVLALVVGVVAGLATGGKLRWAARHPLRDPWLVVVGVIAEFLAGRWSFGWLGAVLLVGGYGCLLAFVARNRTLRGIWVVGVGLLANLVVIVVNAGMPVRPRAVVDAGIVGPAGLPTLHYGSRHHAEGASTHLAWLDDRLPIAVVHSVVSVGDVILAVGVALVVARAMHYQGRYQRRRLGRAGRSNLGLVGRAS
jgi:hypothetical protein